MSHALHQYASEEAAKRGLTKADVFGKSRKLQVVAARDAVVRRLHRDGNSNRQIAHLLDLSHTTVRESLAKTGLRSNAAGVVHKSADPVDCLQVVGA